MNTADMLIHIHPELNADERFDLERNIESLKGVDCAEFSHQPHTHTMIVKYNPEEVEGLSILTMARKLDPLATRVGL